MPFESTKLLHLNQYRKSSKTPFIIYADLESLIKTANECTNNLEKLSITKDNMNMFHYVFNVYNILI